MKLQLILVILLTFMFSGCFFGPQGNLNPTGLNGETLITENFLIKVDRGLIPGARMVHKFGANPSIGNTLVPISISGNYRTPTTAQSLEILSNDADDTFTGAGARTIRVLGLNASGHEIEEEVNLNGVTPVALSNQFLRVYRMYVVTSGTYATQSIPSQQGVITLRNAGGGITWAQLNVVGGFGVGQSEIGSYTVPKGWTCLLLAKTMSVDSSRSVDLYFFQRQDILNTTAPMPSIRLVEKHIGLSGVETIGNGFDPLNKFPELTDIGFMGRSGVAGSSASVEFDLLCLENSVYG